MRVEVTAERLRRFMTELAATAPRNRDGSVYLVGGGTAVLMGWRASSIDVDVFSEDDATFAKIQTIKERLQINVELVRPEHFVPALEGTSQRHVFVERIAPVSFYHYDPYAQLLSKVVRGFARDLEDALNFVRTGWVDLTKLRALVVDVPKGRYASYPQLSPAGVLDAVDAFIESAS